MPKIQAVRGMNDILPSDMPLWHYFETTIKKILIQYGYDEIRFPIVEKSALFHRGVGEGTDIVEKETYDFQDRSGEGITLRPEGTAGCVRAAIEHGLLRNQTQKLWYMGPMFRYERPQKGRYRQFYQLGVEVYGNDHIAQDAELLSLTWKLWQQLGISDEVTLELNCLGTLENRQEYTTELVKYLTPLKSELDEDSQRRLTKNPLRILDSKNTKTQTLLNNAPKLSDFIAQDMQNDFQSLITYLSKLNIPVKVNTRLVRGIDYYSHTVFEWLTDKLGAQSAICAGGRYNRLISDLNGPETPAVGFAMGIERIILLLETIGINSPDPHKPNLYIISDKASILSTMVIIEQLRQTHPHIIIEQNMALGSFKSQFKKADKSGAALALIIAEDELQKKCATIKFLRNDQPQKSVAISQLGQYLNEVFSSDNKLK